MLRLTLADNAIELYENIPVNLSYQFADLQNINSSRSSFSQTFRVPLTKKNQDYFGAVNEFGLIPTWNPKTKVAAELSYNTIPLIRGFAQVKGIYIQKGKYADVEIALFGETANLSQDVGNDMLTDLDFSAFDHDINATQLAASWAGTLFSGQIRYGLPDKGQNWTAANIWTSAVPLEHGDFTPYMRMSTVVDKILTTAGYTYDSTFLSTGAVDMYVCLYNGMLMPASNDVTGGNLLLAGLTADVTGLTATTWTNITSWNVANPFFDQGGSFTSGTTFTAPFRALYEFYWNIWGTTTGGNISFRLTKNGSEMHLLVDSMTSAQFNGITQINQLPDILLDAGDTVTLQYKFDAAGSSLTLEGSGEISNTDTWWYIPNISSVASGGNINVTENMPEIKQIDFISGIQKCFNLVFIPDRHNASHLQIEPFTDYLASGSQKDWTNKIDLSKDISVKPTTDLQKRRYDWTHANGKDIVNEYVSKSASRVYGRYRVEDPDNDFAAGEHATKTPFAPHVVSRIPQTGYVVHRMLVNTTDDNKIIKQPLLRLAFWNDLEPGTLYYQNDANSATITATTYPVFSQYSDLEATVSDADLSFGSEPPFHLIEAYPLNTLYYKYWRPWANELYSADARLMTAFFRLTRSELAIFEFSDKIYIKDSYWRIMSMSFDATSEDLVKVELIKVLGDIRDCTYLPTGIDKANGRIQFSTVAGATVTQVPRMCCVRYGFSYEASTSYCFQPFGQ